MPMFRKKAKLVEAEQFFSNRTPLPFKDRGACCYSAGIWYVVTAHGQETRIVDGDWIVPEPDGRGFYPIKPDIFEKDHEPVMQVDPPKIDKLSKDMQKAWDAYSRSLASANGMVLAAVITYADTMCRLRAECPHNKGWTNHYGMPDDPSYWTCNICGLQSETRRD